MITKLVNGINSARAEYASIMKELEQASDKTAFNYVEQHVFDESSTRGAADDGSGMRNVLALADNIEFIKKLLREGYAGKLQQIYIDPPFFTKAKYNASILVRDNAGKQHRIHHLAYDDRFERNLECYVHNMTVRLLLMRDLLTETGTIWVHLDWHSSHYVKLILDEIMGEQNFINEIIWSYKSGGSGKKHFARKHDSILVYGKSNKYYLHVPEEKSYNRGFKPYHFKGVEEFQDENGWYTLVNMKDVWNIDMVGRTSTERTGYATQKPRELMRRILQSGSREGDIVADFFCGSGSLPEAAQMMGRSWLACDNEELATGMTKKRLDLVEADYQYLAEDALILRPGSFSIEVNQKEQLSNGKLLLSCSIENFIPEIEMGYIQLNDRKYVEEALQIDTKQFIDYVMIDPDFRGDFSCEIVVEKDFDNIKLLTPGNAACVLVDVFGREYFAKI